MNPLARGTSRALTDAQRRGRLAALALTSLRLALAPLLVTLGYQRIDGAPVVLALSAGFLSDVFDGVVARRYEVDTSALRRFDSITDLWFYLAAAYAAWRTHSDLLHANRIGIALVLGMEVLNYVVAMAKFGRNASYHAWSAKLWGALLFGALLLMFARDDGWLVPVALTVALLSQAESVAMTIILPEWQHDVASIVHAWHLRTALARDLPGERT